MVDNIEKHLEEPVLWLTKEYASIRTGQATPALLDGIKVEQYGALVPINQIGSVGIEDARTLRIAPWDTSGISAIESAIRDADLGVSVVSDAGGLRVVFPELTNERRTQLLKIAKTRHEEARVSVRNIRDEVMKDLETKKKSGELSEDAFFAQKEDIQKKVDATNKELEDHYRKKEEEINQ